MKTYKVIYRKQGIEKSSLIDANCRDEAESLLRKRYQSDHIEVIAIKLT